MPAPPNTPGNPWLVKGILVFLGVTAITATTVLFAGKQIQMGAAPVTADADADVIITSSAATQVPFVVQAAAGQSDNILEAQTSNGASKFLINNLGYSFGEHITYTETAALQSYFDSASPLRIKSACGVAWSSDATWYGVKDLGLARKSAGALEVNGGTAATTAGAISVCASASSYLNTQTITEEMTCATGSVTFTSAADLLPANSYIIGVSSRVTQAPADAVTWGMGVAGTLEKFAENLQPKTLGQMTSTWNTGHAAGTGGPTAQLLPFVQSAADKVVITFSADPGATAAKIRITVFYQTLTPPGS